MSRLCRLVRFLPRLTPALLLLTCSDFSARADIFRWDNGQLIPGTEGITPGPGVRLDHRDMAYAALSSLDLTGSRFDFSNLGYANLNFSTLTNANLSGANLANAYMSSATLTNANLSEAVVTGAIFGDLSYGSVIGFTKEQLYSTASYQAKNLAGIGLYNNDLSGWDFSGQDLTNAYLFSSTLTNANLTGAVVIGARFVAVTARGFTQQQLSSTQSYQDKNLTGIGLQGNDLTGWDFTGQNLANASFSYSDAPSNLTNANLAGANLCNANLGYITLTGANLSRAVVTGADFGRTHGFTKQQLYSTASYQAKNLAGIGLGYNDLTGWDFSGQNLANAALYDSTLTNANLSVADTRGAQSLNLTGATSRNAILPAGSIAGLDLSAGDQLVVRNYQGDPNQGLGPIPITIQDHMTLANDGVLQMLFDADPWNSTISFQSGIPVTLGGTLELTFANDVNLASQVGRTIDLFDWTGVNPTGLFDIVSPHIWDLSQLYTTGEVILAAVGPLPGDYNGNGIVDAADYTVWRDKLGAAALVNRSPYIAGPVGPADYAFWRAHFGQSLGSDSGATLPSAESLSPAVPEPGCALLLLSWAAVSACGRRRVALRIP